MSAPIRIALLAAAAVAALAGAPPASPARQTVCTITVNSADEKEAFRRRLPADRYDFVELVERGRSDWLASACSRGVRCDALVISGHFNGSDFFSDWLDDRNEFLPVEEMERVSCSDSCPGLFSQLKEVYLFGCRTLDGEGAVAAADLARSLVRSGHPRADAERLAQTLARRHRESNRDVMRRVFVNVPVLYGFPAAAPLGTAAGPLLDRYLRSAPSADVGDGRTSRKLLANFAPYGMTTAAGLGYSSRAEAAHRAEVCRFVDERLPTAQKLRFIHALLERGMPEVQLFFERIERFLGSLTGEDRREPAVARALDDIAADDAARRRYLVFARDAEEPATRVRMISVARSLGWLSADEQNDDMVSMIGERLARGTIGNADIGLVCSLNKDGGLAPLLDRVAELPSAAREASRSALLACLGSAEHRAAMLALVTGESESDVAIAQVYLHHRPIADPAELRAIGAGIARMHAGEAQVRALDTLAGHHLTDADTLAALVRLFPSTTSVAVQRAIAGVLIRSDYRSIATPELAAMLRGRRLASTAGEDVIDVLIRRIQKDFGIAEPRPVAEPRGTPLASSRRAPARTVHAGASATARARPSS